ncbi:MAG: tannase/feruloyl esterase family alpha/beta hydrolase [Silvibacterium sp.]|nr:tannase/feruloyl esterase family alpha/beta hydrolase [Silvibacterium sp.]
MRRHLVLLVVAAACLSALSAEAQPPGKSCQSLAQGLALSDGKITFAEVVAAGAFVPPGLKQDEKQSPVFKSTPAFCRVTATLTPTPASDIKVEVWMPVSGWNGKFRGQGNGGFAGYIDYQALARAVALGYASGATDTGHAAENTDANWALGQPEKVVDYGYRGIHEMTAQSKSIVRAFYGIAPSRSYFASCSNGGRQALMEALRFPTDYDGILAGAPANNWTPMLTAGIHALQVLDGPGYIPGAKAPAIAKAGAAACDAKDGVRDGVLSDPTQCRFNPEVLVCNGAESDSCLTVPQIAALKSIYAGARDESGNLIFPGIPLGAEDGAGGWALWIFGKEQGKSLMSSFVTGYFSNMVYSSKNWNFRTANVANSLQLANQKTGNVLNATDPNLKPFFDRGGKLIIYHGWNDPAISAFNSINYYHSVSQTLGTKETERSMRLYMVPGMQHCAGGPGATSFGQFEPDVPHDAQHDIFAALVEWVEKGNAPSTLIASHFADEKAGADPPATGSKTPEMTRPLCPYPQEAKYSGKGDQNSASSFSCVGPK